MINETSHTYTRSSHRREALCQVCGLGKQAHDAAPVAVIDLGPVVDETGAPTAQTLAVLTDAAPTRKHCPSCGIDFDRSYFSARSSAKDGLNPVCRSCRSTARGKRRAAKLAANAVIVATIAAKVAKPRKATK